MTQPRNPDFEHPIDHLRSLMQRGAERIPEPLPLFPRPAPEESIYDKRTRLLLTVAQQLCDMGRGRRL